MPSIKSSKKILITNDYKYRASSAGGRSIIIWKLKYELIQDY